MLKLCIQVHTSAHILRAKIEARHRNEVKSGKDREKMAMEKEMEYVFIAQHYYYMINAFLCTTTETVYVFYIVYKSLSFKTNKVQYAVTFVRLSSTTLFHSNPIR